MNRAKFYKQKPLTSAQERQKRIDARNEERAEARIRVQQERRPGLRDDPKRAQLEKWRQAKREKALQAKLNQKPAFRAGVVHHRYYSPVEPPPQARVTRAAAKRAAQQAVAATGNQAAGFKFTETSVKLTIPRTPPVFQVRPLRATSTQVRVKADSRPQRNGSPIHEKGADDTNSAGPSGQHVSQTPTDESTEPPNMASGDIEDWERAQQMAIPVRSSPFVTSIRGKFGSASYTRAKHSAGCQPFPQKSESEHGVKYFRDIMEKEIAGLESLSAYWTELRNNLPNIPDDIDDTINSVVGRMRLLIDDKLGQFRTLIDSCEFGTEGVTVIPSDLEGFWDMVYLQITSIKGEFDKLTKLEQNNWKEESVPLKRGHAKKKPTSKPVTNMGGVSRLKAVIAEARRRKDAEAAAAEESLKNGMSPRVSSCGLMAANRTSVTKSGLSTASSSMNQALLPALMRVSVIAKQFGTPTREIKSPPVHQPVDLTAVPIKSILKSSNKQQVNSGEDITLAAAPGARKVLFSDGDDSKEKSVQPIDGDKSDQCQTPSTMETDFTYERENDPHHHSHSTRQVTPYVRRSKRLSQQSPGITDTPPAATPRRSSRLSLLRM